MTVLNKVPKSAVYCYRNIHGERVYNNKRFMYIEKRYGVVVRYLKNK